MEAGKFKKADITAEKCIKKGPPPTYKIEPNWEGKTLFVKEYTNEVSANEVKKCWDDAREKGIRTPAYGIQKLEEKYYFWTEKCKGERFFKAKTHVEIIYKWLNKHTDILFLTKLLVMFGQHNRGDAQGFFQEVENGCIEFIDLGNKTISLPQMQQFIPAIEARIAYLKAHPEVRTDA